MKSTALKDIVNACLKLYQKSLVANHDGNITFKIPEGFIATPTSFSKGDITESDLLILDESGKVIEGKHKVFSEIAIHLAIYNLRPDINCVVHAHPPTASSFGLAGVEIGVPAIPEAIVSLGRNILNAKSVENTELSRVLIESDAFILVGNGGWTVGQDIMQTYYRMELLEHIALQHFRALQLGGVQKISEDKIEELLKKRPNSQLRELVAEEVRHLFSLSK